MFVTVFPHTLHWAKPMGSLSYMLKCPDLCGVYDPGKEEKKIYVVNFFFYDLTSIHIFHDAKNKHNYVSTSHYAGLYRVSHSLPNLAFL